MLPAHVDRWQPAQSQHLQEHRKAEGSTIRLNSARSGTLQAICQANTATKAQCFKFMLAGQTTLLGCSVRAKYVSFKPCYWHS
jgi:hypothetical protein